MGSARRTIDMAAAKEQERAAGLRRRDESRACGSRGGGARQLRRRGRSAARDRRRSPRRDWPSERVQVGVGIERDDATVIRRVSRRCDRDKRRATRRGVRAAPQRHSHKGGQGRRATKQAMDRGGEERARRRRRAGRQCALRLYGGLGWPPVDRAMEWHRGASWRVGRGEEHRRRLAKASDLSS